MPTAPDNFLPYGRYISGVVLSSTTMHADGAVLLATTLRSRSEAYAMAFIERVG